MIVRLTHTQARVVQDRIPELHAETMVENCQVSGRTQKDYVLPAIAWRQVLDTLTATAFGPLGGMKQSEPDSLYTAIQRIQISLAQREHHPALRGEALMGIEPEPIPAWNVGGAKFSPFPLEVRPFRILRPHFRELDGHNITEWVPEKPDSLGPWLEDEATHLAFVTDPEHA